jgi:hypothetical protein
MTGRLKWLPCILLLSASFGAQAQTINAASCSSSAVQSALSSVSSDGTTVVIPAGTCSWTTTVNYNQAFSTTIQGQTTCTGTPASSCTDNTVIADAASGDSAAFQVTTAASKSFRLTGVTFTGGNSNQWTGGVRVFGRSQQVRIDHVHFLNIANTAIATNNVLGVMDHDVFDIGNNQEGWRPLNTSWNGVGQSGDNSWADDTGLGTNKFFFLEDSTVNGVGQQGGATNDCFSGGRYVVRHNVLNDSSVQGHTTGHAGDDRGCRAQEFYLNTMPAPPGGIIAFNSVDLESGPAMVWGNTATNYSNFITAHIKRESNATYTQSASPNGWGYCGTNENGTSSPWDQNTVSATGYACLDQLGRGKGDLLSGLFPNKVNTARGNTIAWTRQAVEPSYVWGNTWGCQSCGGTSLAIYDPGIVLNRDIFTSVGALCSGPSCTTGVGSGLLSARPASCTTNTAEYPTGNHPGVGYWATDTNTLYVCTATNTWTAYYMPYTYPHPLTTSSGNVGGTAPSAPTGLQTVVN